MNKRLWAFQIIMMLAFGLFGLQKVFIAIPDLIAMGMLWIEDFPAWQVRLIGLLEAAGAAGLIMPYVVKAVPKSIVPLAAAGLALMMIGASATHVVRGDPALSVIVTTVLFVMGVTVALKRHRQFKYER